MNDIIPMQERWIKPLDDITGQFKESFSELSVSALNWKFSPQSWSIAQNIEHLIVINSSYFNVVESVRNGTYQLPWVAKMTFMVEWMGKTILNSVQPDRRKKMKTFPAWVPSQNFIEADVLERFVQHQEMLKGLIRSCDTLLSRNAIISSPVNRNIVYKLETAFDILVTHEQRHFQQAKEVLTRMKLQPD